jgi:hypothetical protein
VQRPLIYLHRHPLRIGRSASQRQGLPYFEPAAITVSRHLKIPRTTGAHAERQGANVVYRWPTAVITASDLLRRVLAGICRECRLRKFWMSLTWLPEYSVCAQGIVHELQSTQERRVIVYLGVLRLRLYHLVCDTSL